MFVAENLKCGSGGGSGGGSSSSNSSSCCRSPIAYETQIRKKNGKGMFVIGCIFDGKLDRNPVKL